MSRQQATDLGSGVRVIDQTDGSVIVTSPGLDLGWAVGAERLPGSAVLWRDEPYEVVDRVVTSIDCRWMLQPWPDTESIRTSSVLSRALVEEVATERSQDRRAQRLHWWSLPALPLLGLAPRVLQQRWRSEWGFPSGWATAVSALFELGAGNLLFVHLLSLLLGGGPVLSWAPPVPVTGLLASLLTCESLVRLVIANADGLGVGSVFGLPLLLFTDTAVTAVAQQPPPVGIERREDGLLVIESTLRRPDWEVDDGFLTYRSRRHELDRVARAGDRWAYHFRPADETTPGATASDLRLRPPSPAKLDRRRRNPDVGTLIRRALLTIPICFAPREYQERWGLTLDFPPAGLTAISASAELIGGAVNGLAHGSEGSPLLWLDLLLLGDGAVRLVLATIRRTASASVFGWPLRPLYERWTDPR